MNKKHIYGELLKKIDNEFSECWRQLNYTLFEKEEKMNSEKLSWWTRRIWEESFMVKHTSSKQSLFIENDMKMYMVKYTQKFRKQHSTPELIFSGCQYKYRLHAFNKKNMNSYISIHLRSICEQSWFSWVGFTRRKKQLSHFYCLIGFLVSEYTLLIPCCVSKICLIAMILIKLD